VNVSISHFHHDGGVWSKSLIKNVYLGHREHVLSLSLFFFKILFSDFGSACELKRVSVDEAFRCMNRICGIVDDSDSDSRKVQFFL